MSFPHPLPPSPSLTATCSVHLLEISRLALEERESSSGGDHSNWEWPTPVFCFLIRHDGGKGDGKWVMFDLGGRSDWTTAYSPALVQKCKAMNYRCRHLVKDLSRGGVNVTNGDIGLVVLSHYHYDHVGAPSNFSQTNSPSQFLVGKGTYQNSLDLKSQVPASHISEINFQTSNIQSPAPADNSPSPSGNSSDAYTAILEDARFGSIAYFDGALDIFGDGSFWILDTPGHAEGHVSALIRTTIGEKETGEDDTWILLGGDVCHHSCLLHPLESDSFGKRMEMPLEKDIRDLYQFPATAIETVSLVRKMEALPNVACIIAHDTAWEGIIRSGEFIEDEEEGLNYYNFGEKKLFKEGLGKVNEWKKNGWKNRVAKEREYGRHPVHKFQVGGCQCGNLK